ncbi:hypothetical protein TBR22_A01880 [Luteitalea sp. TBR-22]|nr:hypothetical protein TBR22_A01880 [Luteitalea sp. TBR-22]
MSIRVSECRREYRYAPVADARLAAIVMPRARPTVVPVNRGFMGHLRLEEDRLRRIVAEPVHVVNGLTERQAPT